MIVIIIIIIIESQEYIFSSINHTLCRVPPEFNAISIHILVNARNIDTYSHPGKRQKVKKKNKKQRHLFYITKTFVSTITRNVWDFYFFFFLLKFVDVISCSLNSIFQCSLLSLCIVILFSINFPSS